MHPVLIKIGSINVYAWGFTLAIAVIIAILGIGRLFAREGYEREAALEMMIIMVISGLAGARLLYIIIYEWKTFIQQPGSFFSLAHGFSGLVWYGGVAGALVPFFIYLRKKGWDFWVVTDIMAPYTALGYAIVRIGCLLNGCCYGKITTSAWGVVFPVVDSYPRYPTQLYSSLINFLIFMFLIWLYPRRKFVGQVFVAYLIAYPVYRIIIEYFRENLIMYGTISMGQVYTMALLILAIFLYFYRMKSQRVERSKSEHWGRS